MRSTTDQTGLIRSHSSAKFCFELSGNSNYSMEILVWVFFLSTYSHVLFWGHWYPCFGFLVTSALGVKARVGCLFTPSRQMQRIYPEIHLWCTCCQPLDGQHCWGGNLRQQPSITTYQYTPQALSWIQMYLLYFCRIRNAWPNVIGSFAPSVVLNSCCREGEDTTDFHFQAGLFLSNDTEKIPYC